MTPFSSSTPTRMNSPVKKSSVLHSISSSISSTSMRVMLKRTMATSMATTPGDRLGDGLRDEQKDGQSRQTSPLVKKRVVDFRIQKIVTNFFQQQLH
jgi:hypothetical protein